MNTHNHNELMDCDQINLNANLYILKEDEDNPHYFLKLPPSSFPSLNLNDLEDVCNIAMIDVSGSMRYCWNNLMSGWNNYIVPKLLGTTHVYTFSDYVTKIPECELNDSCFDKGLTNLTDALSTIQTEIYQCREKNINVLLVTDGHHTISGTKSPGSVIKTMKIPKGKICNVFVFGIGSTFPVQYSIDIRSKLHNGRENIPPLFWAKEYDETLEVIKNIGDEMSQSNQSSVVSLSIPGFLLPGSSPQHDFHVGDWIYMSPEIENSDQFQIIYNNYIDTLHLKPIEGTEEIMEEIFCQWNSTLIKLHTLNKTIPKGVIDLEKKIFEFYKNQKLKKEEHNYSIKQRIKNNQKEQEDTPYENRFYQQIRKLENILTDAKYKNEIQLAKDILNTSVVRNKYQEKSFRLKGHTDVDYQSDVAVFLRVLNQNKEQINNIDVATDECCRITLQSTITDIQDEDLIKMIETFDKFAFLKSFTMSGIPVFAPTRDSVSLNPWSYSIQNIVTSPYSIMSQIALESYNPEAMEGEHKKIKIKNNDIRTTVNAIIPIFSPEHAKIMQPIVKTKIYAMCSTFAITKNPYIIDFDIHIAALAVAWIRSLYEIQTFPIPEYVRNRMQNIEATAELYMNDKRFIVYCSQLLNNTTQALMTESTEIIPSYNKTIKCESLIKPVFFLFMKAKKCIIPKENIIDIMKLILIEYIGRCITTEDRTSDKYYCNFYIESLDELITDLIKKKTSSLYDKYKFQNILENFYTLEEVSKAAKEITNENSDLLCNFVPKVSLDKIEQLRNVASAGDISWQTLKIFSRYIGLNEHQVDDLFSEKNIFIYTCHALEHKSSRIRMASPIEDFDQSHRIVCENIKNELYKVFMDQFQSNFTKAMEEAWIKSYLNTHTEIVEPMTRQQIISEAQKRGIDVTNDSFVTVYNNFRESGLLSNACQTRACPYYLIPRKNYNNHGSVERKMSKNFLHGLHKICYTYSNDTGDEIMTKFNSPEKIVENMEAIRYLQNKYKNLSLKISN